MPILWRRRARQIAPDRGRKRLMACCGDYRCNRIEFFYGTSRTARVDKAQYQEQPLEITASRSKSPPARPSGPINKRLRAKIRPQQRRWRLDRSSASDLERQTVLQP